MVKPPESPEFMRFTDAMRKIMKVSKEELKRRIDQDKADKLEGNSTPTTQGS
jgi:hypothetical protein